MSPPTQRSSSLPQHRERSPSHLDFPVVGIGASAGGLQAIKRFFEHMPMDNGMAFVVILHLAPDHQSFADNIIQESTQMPVLQVTEAVSIQKNHVYVISPAQQLQMEDGYLRVTPAEPRHGRHVAIDLFFRDLADVHKDRAFCLVLSGTGSDGAVGLSRIKEQGGVTMAQSPEDAEFDGMPQAAIDTQMVDLVLPVAQMPQKLLELWRNAQEIRLTSDNAPQLHTQPAASEREAAVIEQFLHDILHQLRSGTGHDFKHYKRATVLRRIERRMQVTGQPDLQTYYTYLLDYPEETKSLLGDLLIGVTNFFRDREAFEALERDVLPNLFKPVEPGGQAREEIRVWSAGCSTGEEAYTLAMLLSDQLQVDNNAIKLQVFATDIDERAITVGRNGAYSQAIITDVPPTHLRQYFLKDSAYYRVRKEIRERVLFAKHSLLSDPPFSQIDLIVCRNLLIYLDREVQREILQMFHFALRPGGYLFLGSSESAEACSDLFTPVDKRNRIFRAKYGTANSRRTPTMPRGGYLRGSSTQVAAQNVSPRKVSFADIHLRAIERAAQPSMIVDATADILHMSENAGQYLRHVGGEMSRNLLTLILPQLRLEVRATLFQVHQSGQPVKSRQVTLDRVGRRYLVGLLAQPYRDEESDGEFVLVMFEEVEVDPAQLIEAASQTENQVLSNLERELQRTKLHLQDTIEQAEVSSEELKASNEEMQAINEELRSATEELETSKEELQSINEELLTVNYELKTKVEETDKINDYLTNLIASTDIATVFVDRNMRIKWFTPRATQIFSMLPVDTGRSLLDITHRLDYPDLAEDASQVFISLNMIEREVSGNDGRWYIARLLPYRSSEDHIDGTVLTFIDITKRREAEEELRLGEEQTRRLMETQNTSLLKDEFFAVMSHELKHPLNLILLNAELLRRLPVTKTVNAAAKAVNTICDAVASQARIIDDLLDVARVRTGKLKLKRQPVDLGLMLQHIYTAVINDNNPNKVSLELPQGPGSELTVNADPTRLEQIIWNLVNNALKFTPGEGRVQLIASLDGTMARLEVKDSGMGIAAEHLNEVFDLFGQVDTQHATQQREGLGIGLSLVRQLTEAHGGSVQVSSEGLGKGSTFTLHLPLSETDETQARTPPNTEHSGRLSGLTILLVDDSPDVLETLKLLLEMEDAQVIAFDQPLQALQAARDARFDVVICDLGMPVMNGHELMQALRELPNGKHIPAIALTGYGTPIDMKKSRQSGVDQHIDKPVSYDELIDTIELLRRSRKT